MKINLFNIKHRQNSKLLDVSENWHEDFIVHLAKITKPNLYMELGLYECRLFNRIEPYTKKMIGIDINQAAGKKMIKSPKANFYCLTTDEYANKLQENPLSIDMLFIDADHSRKSVMSDFKNYFPFVSDQGLIIFHDGHPKNKKYTNTRYCGDGYLAIDEISRNATGYEMVTIPVHPGITILRKRKSQLSWDK